MVMKQLTDTHGMVAIVAKIFRQKNNISCNSIIVSDSIVTYHAINACGRRSESGHNGCAGWTTQWSLTMRVGKQYTLRSQSVNIRC